MQLRKKLAALLLVSVLLCSMSIVAYAHEAPDISKKGTISITMRYNKNPVAGGSLTLYRVGDIKEDDGNYSFTLTEDFTASQADLTDITSANLAKQFAQYAKDQKISGEAVKINDNGEVSFSDLDLGLYLLTQNEAASGYAAADPFLVTVPMNENGTYIYAVDASPKVELSKAPETPTTPTGGSGTTSTSTTVITKLPQTGQLNWPIPVLAVVGLGLFSIGWVLCFGKEKECYES